MFKTIFGNLLIFFVPFVLSGQSINFEIGQTTSFYSHKTQSPEINFFTTTGQSFRFSYSKEFLNNHEVSFGISLEQANSIGRVINTELIYDTRFLGVFTKLDYRIISVANRKFCASCTNIQLFATIGGQLSSLVAGTQKINESTFNLKGVEDFKGIWISPLIGLKLRFDASDLVSLYGAYEFIPMINITDNKEKFKINQSIIIFGFRLWL